MLAELLTACDQLVKEIIAVYAPIAEQQREDSLAKLRSELTRRVEVVQTVNRVHEQLGISLSPAPAEQQVPLTPKALGAEAFHRRSAAGEPLPALVREAREGVISTIASFATALESLPETAGHLAEFGEEQLRDVLLFVLNANWRGQAAGEVFTNRGKTDISIFAADRRLFTAELKWWHGAKQLTAAIDQLAGYTIARDTAACLIMLSKAKNFTQMQYTAETTIAAHPHITGRIPTPDDKPARVQLRSSVDEGRMIELVFLPVCLTLPTT
ncbi:hypothetical protein [Luteococcus sp.]|uniref:hypothetical protein n=1 Tax=Luteococcus sp. TaxID=1969402 RepID=UPI003736E19E